MCKEGLEMYGMLDEGVELKKYLNGPIGVHTKFRNHTPTRKFYSKKREERFGTVAEEHDEHFICVCGNEFKNRNHVAAE